MKKPAKKATAKKPATKPAIKADNTVEYKTYKWVYEPPTKEELEKKDAQEREKLRGFLRGVGYYLAGMKRAGTIAPLTDDHLNAIWSAVDRLMVAPPIAEPDNTWMKMAGKETTRK